MRINHNMMAMNTHRQLGVATSAGAKSMEKLSSGYRINRAGDDAAGLSISEKMRNQVRGLNRASANSQDGISLIQTAEGALDETHAILKRMRELTVQAGNEATQETDDMQAIQDEFNELKKEIDGIAFRTEFNGKKLLTASGAKMDKDTGAISNVGKGFSGFLQIGANKEQQMDIDINMAQRDAADEKVGLSVTNLGSEDKSLSGVKFVDGNKKYTKAMFDEDIQAVDGAIKQISGTRSKLGANQNRLEHTIKNLDNAAENIQASESRIRDVDMAKEMMEQTKQNILQQASTAMLAQANMAPQTVLQLLG